MHGVHLYAHADSKAAEARRFLAPVLDAGGAALIIGGAAMRRALEDLGERAVFLDAAETLARFDAGGLDESAFRRVVGRAIKDAAALGDGTVAAYGDIVALLWRQGRQEEAIRLEELWNGLDGFTLLCGYPSEAVRPAGRTMVCDVHTHVAVD